MPHQPTTIHKTVRLHPEQQRFRLSDAPYRGFVGGIGSGKTWIGAYDLIRRARRGRTYMAGSPTAVMMTDNTFPTFRAIATELGVWHPGKVKLTPYPTAELTTGATIRFRTAEDPEKMRGPNLSGVWLDEGSLMPRSAYEISIGRLREGGEQGWLSVTFTPKGLGHWTYEVFGQQTPNTETFHARTRDNPFLPPGFHDQLAEQYVGSLAGQELDGRFLSLEGVEWPPDYFDYPGFWFERWPHKLEIRTLSLDPSKGKDAHLPDPNARRRKLGDYSAFIRYGRDGQGTEYVEADLARRDTEKIVAEGVEHVRQFRPDGFAIEVNQFQELLCPDFLRVGQAQGVDLPIYKITNTVNKLVRIRRIGPALAQRRIRFKAGSAGTLLLVQQLRDFPVGEHDDGPDALEMARRLAIELMNGRQKKTPQRMAV